VVTNPDPIPGPTVLDAQYDEARRALDAKALVWARTTRRWMWIGGFALLIALAAGVRFLVF
jgi:hypothetical protein